MAMGIALGFHRAPAQATENSGRLSCCRGQGLRAATWPQTPFVHPSRALVTASCRLEGAWNGQITGANPDSRLI